MVADLRAYERYLNSGWEQGQPFLFVPRSDNADPQNPTNFYLLLDLAEVGRRRNEPEVREALTHHVQSVSRDDFIGGLYAIYTGGTTKDLRSITMDDFLRATAQSPQHPGQGNFALPEYNISVVDHRSTSLSKIIGLVAGDNIALKNIGSQHENTAQELIRHHEAAHTILGLGEAGSDFVAAVTLLRDRDTPETRETLQIFADFRMLNSKIDLTHNVECTDAIEMALNGDPTRLRSMSMEDIYGIAKIIDIKEEKMVAMRRYVADSEWGPPKNLSFGVSDIPEFLEKCWERVTKGEIPNFGEVYDDVRRENDQKLNSYRQYLSRVDAENQPDYDEAKSRMKNYYTPANL